MSFLEIIIKLLFSTNLLFPIMSIFFPSTFDNSFKLESVIFNSEIERYKGTDVFGNGIYDTEKSVTTGIGAFFNTDVTISNKIDFFTNPGIMMGKKRYFENIVFSTFNIRYKIDNNNSVSVGYLYHFISGISGHESFDNPQLDLGYDRKLSEKFILNFGLRFPLVKYIYRANNELVNLKYAVRIGLDFNF